MDQETYSNVVYPLFGYIPPDDLARWQANARRALADRTGSRSPR